MFNIYQKYLAVKFVKKLFFITIIFMSLIFILNALEEISFLKYSNKSILFPYFLSLINTPTTLFEIFPFILLLSGQFLIYEIYKNNELDLLRQNSLSNLKIVKLLFFIALLIGIFNVTIFYNFSALLKFHYSNIKNEISEDNKYLAMVLETGIWIKDEINNKKLIINSKKIKDDFLLDTTINEFNNEFNLIQTIQVKKINIKNNVWLLYDPLITKDNKEFTISNKVEYTTNFNKKRINSLFSNVSTLDLFRLINMKKEFDKLGYSTDEIIVHLLTLFFTPLVYGFMVVISALLVINFNKNKSFLFNIVVGIAISVIIYYINFLFSSLGTSSTIPVFLSVLFPLGIIGILSTIGLIQINDN
jgi:lipopolysaccharide export system permease protein